MPHLATRPASTAAHPYSDAVATTVAQALREAEGFADQLAKTATERERNGVLPVEEVAWLRSSNLVNLVIPAKFGGLGGRVSDAVKAITEVSRGDGSVGALLGYHFTNSGVARLFDLDGEGQAVDRQSASHSWFWANISQPHLKEFIARPSSEGFTISGVKPWNTGVRLADVTTLIAHRADRKELLYAYIPTDRKGLRLHDDWDHLGLRLTDTITITFDNLTVRTDEVFTSSWGPVVGFPPLYGAIAELYFAAYYLGSSLAALEAARDYTRRLSRPWPGSGVDAATKDPYILRDYGEFWTKVQAVRTYLTVIADEVSDAFDQRRHITARQRAELMVKANSARVLSTWVGLEVTPRIYDVTGARATANGFGFDRFWRDIREHTLHDSHAYKVRSIGDFFLNGVANELPSFV